MARPQQDARKRLIRNLIERVAEDTYPSSTMMDTIEEMLTEDEFEAYVDVLLSHVESDLYPSVTMIGRVQALTES